MNESDKRFRAALARLAEVASAADTGDRPDDEGDRTRGPEPAGSMHEIVCTPKVLPKRLLVKAAQTAVEINPVNAPALGPLAAAGEKIDPLLIATLTSKYWGPTPRRLTVSFMEATPAELQRRVLGHMNAWTRTACIEFVPTGGAGDVRITRAQPGYWSYLGTDILHVPTNRPTMCLQGFTMSTPESEFQRVVRHQTGHTLGFPHEHMRKALIERIDREKAYQYFLTTLGWDRPTVDAQVLAPLDERSIMGTPPDQTSIMSWQLPASITRDGQAIIGGVQISPTDYAFAGKIYPKPVREPAGTDDDWEHDFTPVADGGEREIANDEIPQAEPGRQLCMAERYEGVVEHVHRDRVVVVYEVGGDLVEQTYEKSQFVDGRLPKKGDRLAVSVSVTKLPPPAADKAHAPEVTNEPAENWRRPITGPVES